MGLRVKICGVTNVDDAVACARAGAHAVGVNLIPASKRCVTEEAAAEIVRAVEGLYLSRGRVRVVLVVADLGVPAMTGLRARVGARWLQLHGDETPDDVTALLPEAYKAVRVGSVEDMVRARAYPGELLLVDAKVEGELGGTGKVLDWRLLSKFATQSRQLILAGGLTPDNVAEAVRAVQPSWVDVASGVEVPGDPRRKDIERVRAFVERACGPTS